MDKRVSLPGIIASGCIVGLVIFLVNWNIQAKTPVPRPLKIGLVDVSKVLEGYGKRVDFNKQLEELKAQKQMEIDRKRLDRQSKKDKIELLLPGSSERKKLEDSISNLDIEINVMSEAALKSINEMYAKMLVQLYQEITEECSAYAEAEGYDLIIKKEKVNFEGLFPREIQFTINLQKIIYNSSDLDITPAIIERVQEKYESSGGSSREDES